MNEEDIKKLKDKFFKSFPVEFVGISGKIGTEFEFNSLDEFHSFANFSGQDCFKAHRKQKEDMPSLFLIPYKKSQVQERGSMLFEMGRKTGVLLEQGEEHENKVITIACRFTDTLSKTLASNIISGMLDDFNAKYYAFCSEVFMVKSEKGIQINPNIMPSEHPKRVEALMINSCSDKEQILTTKTIVEDTLSKSEETRADVSDSGGRFSNLFKEIRTNQTAH